MRIIFDAYELVRGQGKSIGIYNYAKNLLQAMQEILDDSIELIVLCNGVNQADFSYEHPAIKTVVVIHSAPDKKNRLLWYFGGAAWYCKQFRADAYFSPKGFCPLAINRLSPQIKTSVVIHDLIPLWYAEHFPGYFGYLEEFFITRSLSASAKYADKIIAISQATADDISKRTGRTKDMAVIYNGVPFSAPGARPYDKPYLLAMASPLPHKNADGVLAAYQAYRRYSAEPLPLFLIGVPNINQPGVTSVIGLYDADLHAYYAHAELFIFLSLTEGFGFPPVEALAHGVPVLCSDIPVLREVSKGMANYIDPADAEVVGQKIAQLLMQANTQALIEQRRQILNTYSWRACAEQALAFIAG